MLLRVYKKLAFFCRLILDFTFWNEARAFVERDGVPFCEKNAGDFIIAFDLFELYVNIFKEKMQLQRYYRLGMSLQRSS